MDSSSSDPQSNSNPETTPQDQKLNLSYSTVSIISAIVAGDLVATLPAPFEYAKIQMRVNPDLAQKGYWHTLKHVLFRADQLKECRKALSPLMLFNIPRVTSRFLTFQKAKELIITPSLQLDIFLAGFCGGLVEGAFFATPQRNLQAKIMAGLFQPNPQFRQFTSLGDALKKIFAQEGFRGTFKRLPAIALKEGFYNGALFITFVQSCTLLQPHVTLLPRGTLEARIQDILLTAICGGASGLLCGLVSAPFEIAQNRFALEASSGQRMMEYISQTQKKEGFGAFFRGIGPRALSSSLNSAIAFTAFDVMFRSLQEL